jgi:hypothetical protein
MTNTTVNESVAPVEDDFDDMQTEPVIIIVEPNGKTMVLLPEEEAAWARELAKKKKPAA